MKRAIFDLILLIFIFTFPWWVGAILAFLGVFIFKKYYEFIFTFFIIFGLYNPYGFSSLSQAIIFCLITIVIYLVIQTFRRYIILYK